MSVKIEHTLIISENGNETKLTVEEAKNRLLELRDEVKRLIKLRDGIDEALLKLNVIPRGIPSSKESIPKKKSIPTKKSLDKLLSAMKLGTEYTVAELAKLIDHKNLSNVRELLKYLAESRRVIARTSPAGRTHGGRLVLWSIAPLQTVPLQHNVLPPVETNDAGHIDLTAIRKEEESRRILRREN